MSVSPPYAPPPTVHTPWRLVTLLGALTAVGPMAIDMYLSGLTAMQADLHATPAQGQMSVASFFAGMALGQFLYGPASDRFGRRVPILIGMSIFLVASAACALASSIEMLIAARFVQAIGACAGQVCARAVVRDHFDHQNTARVLSLLTLVMGLAPILAPQLGGFVLLVASWRAIFWLMFAIGGAIGLWTLLSLKESQSKEARAVARQESVLGSFIALGKQRRLVGYALGGALNGATLFTYVAGSSALVIEVYGVSPAWFPLVFAVNAIAVIGSSQVNRILLRRVASDTILKRASLVAIGFALALTLFAVTGWGGPWTVLPLIFCVLSSYSFAQNNTMAGALSVDPLRAGSISAVMGAAAFGAGALAALVVSSFHDGTARPMALGMLFALCGSSVAIYGLALRRS